MDTKLLEYILAIAQEKNMTKAAQRLYITQPTLSQALSKLEQELGTPLFSRLHNEMILTPAGQDYVDTARQILILKHQLYQKIKKGAEGIHYSLGVCSRWGIDVVSNLLPFYQKRPHPVYFDIIDKPPAFLIQQLTEGTLDLAVITVPNPNEFTGAEIIYQEEIVLAAPETWINQNETECCKSAQEILSLFTELPFILTPKGMSIRTVSDQFLNENHFQVTSTCEINNMTGALHLTERELGFSFIPASRKEFNLPVRYFSAVPPLYRYHVLLFRKNCFTRTQQQELAAQMREAAAML